jgi:hypothetical protein
MKSISKAASMLIWNYGLFLLVSCLSFGWIFLNGPLSRLDSHDRISLPCMKAIYSPSFHFDDTGVPQCPNRSIEESSPIPNVIHYMTLDDKEMTFLEWLAIRSAIHYLRPDKIYLHGESEPVGEWYRKLCEHHSTIVQFHLIPMPRQTIFGVPLKRMAHRSDFLRLAILYCYGGVYMDTDILVLRSFDDLRESGFDAVYAAGHAPKTVGFSVWLSKSHTDLLRVHLQRAHHAFNGKYTTHSTQLLASLIYRSNISSFGSTRFLLLKPSAFFPFPPEPNQIFEYWHDAPDPHRLAPFASSYCIHLYHLLERHWGFSRWWSSISSPTLDWFIAHHNSSVIAYLMRPVLQASFYQNELAF